MPPATQDGLPPPIWALIIVGLGITVGPALMNLGKWPARDGDAHLQRLNHFNPPYDLSGEVMTDGAGIAMFPFNGTGLQGWWDRMERVPTCEWTPPYLGPDDDPNRDAMMVFSDRVAFRSSPLARIKFECHGHPR